MNTCPIEDILKGKAPCGKAFNRLQEKGNCVDKVDAEKCPWYINSEEHNHCFWLYICDKKNQRDRQLTEIATLLNTSTNNVKLIETSAFKKIRDLLTHLR